MFELSWQQFSQQPGISKLPLNEQLRQFQFAQQRYMVHQQYIVNTMVNPGGGGGPSGPTVDVDAQLFITNASITNPIQQTAINKLVTDLKGYGIWTKIKALYPMVGGTATQHKFNLKNPIDSDSAFRIIFAGGGLHTATGYLPNRTNAWGDTKLSPSTVLTNNNYHLSYYSRTQALGWPTAEIGGITSNTQAFGISLNYASVGKLFQASTYPTDSVIVNNTDTTGFMIGSRVNINSAKIFQDGSLLGTNTVTNSGTLPTVTLGLCTQNYNSSFVGQSEWSDKECALASIGDGLTDTEAANYNTAVQLFQTTLSRNV